MKVQIKKPGGHVLQVDGRVKDVHALINAWWAGTEEEERPRRQPAGFQMEEKNEHSDPA